MFLKGRRIDFILKNKKQNKNTTKLPSAVDAKIGLGSIIAPPVECKVNEYLVFIW